MISVVYSTNKDQEYIDKMNKYIVQTSGIQSQYIETVHIENDNEHSISEIYNGALFKTKFNIVLFITDDIKFVNTNWGINLMNAFKAGNIGIIGVLGTIRMSSSGDFWTDDKTLTGKVWYRNPDIEWDYRKKLYGQEHVGKISRVQVLHGVFMAVYKPRLHTTFNEKLIGNSHYDTAFCIDNYVNGVEIGVIYDIDILNEDNKFAKEDHEKLKPKFIELYNEKIETLK